MTDIHSIPDERPPSPAAGRAHVAATFVEVVGWIIGLGGIAVGLVLIGTAGRTLDPTETRFIGLGTVIGGMIYAAIVIMISAYIQSRTE